MAGVRAENRERIEAAILGAARRQVAEHGSGLSMRAVAREVGLVSSAVYRYFPSREALLTRMIVESYQSLAARLREPAPTPSASPAERWRALGERLRAWALSSPHEFQLIYGTPLPGYVAPAETILAATEVAAAFLVVGAQAPVPGFDSPALTRQMEGVAELVVGGSSSGGAAVLAELASLIGMVSLELGGHFVGTADPTDHLYAALLERQIRTLMLE